MIILALFQDIDEVGRLFLKDLASPARLMSVYRHQDFSEYRKEISDAKSTIDKYLAMTEPRKKAEIRFWLKSVKPAHDKFAKQFSGRGTAGYEDVDLNKVDISKIDLLLIAGGLPPVLHDGDEETRWLFNVDIKKGAPFLINSKIDTWPKPLTSNIPAAFSGPAGFIQDFSFEGQPANQSKRVFRWAAKGADFRQIGKLSSHLYDR